MKLSNHIKYAIDDVLAGKPDAGLLHACIAIDATSKRLFPKTRQVGPRYVNCIRRYYWLIEPMLGGGIDLEQTLFANVPLEKAKTPDFADLIYEIFRCSHAHGDDIPAQFSLIPTRGQFNSAWELGANELHMPDRVVWALLGVTVFSEVNAKERTNSEHYLSLGTEIFRISEWWGREKDFRPIADRYNQVRVRMESLGQLLDTPKKEGGEIANLFILNPPQSGS